MSPMLENPTDTIVSPSRCFKTFRGCRYFIDKNEEKEGLEVFNEKIDQEIKFYPEVNILNEKIDSNCEYFQLIKIESGFIAYCKILGRIITSANADLCSKYWQKCPIRETK